METKPKIIYQIYRKRLPGPGRKKEIQYGVAFKFATESEREIFKENVKLCYEELISDSKNSSSEPEKPTTIDEKTEPVEVKTEETSEPKEEPKRRGRPPRQDVQG